LSTKDLFLKFLLGNREQDEHTS